ncbi:MAG: UdgX family uracil-DNA binding protein [Acidobacteriota bacterium]
MREARTVPDFASWRARALELLSAQAPPENVLWVEEASEGEERLLPGLAASEPAPDSVTQSEDPRPRVPARFVALAKKVSVHRDAARWSILYCVLWRLTHGERGLLSRELDPDLRRLELMSRQIDRDVHKMHAFVRFRKVIDDEGERFVAWYRPDHRILRVAAPFFRDRFASMRWSILTPDESAHWDGAALRFDGGLPRSAAPREDEMEGLWRAYYASIFNPARVNQRAQRAEMPLRFWNEMPETRAIPQLLAAASDRVGGMIRDQQAAPSAAPFLPPESSRDVVSLEAAARSCRGCDLWEPATQTVFGRGRASARLVLVGEQPGDEEDRRGEPFVGPAGKVLDRALTQAGIPREEIYVTNAVKHFKYIERGVRRIHNTPRQIEILACRPWLEAELQAIQPEVVVCLGASAAKALLSPTFTMRASRGRFFDSPSGPRKMATWHPSAVLRAGDQAASDALFADLVADLKTAAAAASESAAPSRPLPGLGERGG